MQVGSCIRNLDVFSQPPGDQSEELPVDEILVGGMFQQFLSSVSGKVFTLGADC